MATSEFLLTPDSLLYPPDGSVIEQLDRLITEMESRYRQFAKRTSTMWWVGV